MLNYLLQVLLYFYTLKIRSIYYFVIFFLNRKMRGHGIYGSLQLSKFMRNRCSEESPCRFQLLITRYLGGSSEDSLCPAQTAKRKTEPASNNSKHSGKHLNTQSMFCVCMKANYLNILKGFSVITNTKDFIVFLEKVKRSMCFFEEQASPTQRTINGKHQEDRMREKRGSGRQESGQHSIS